MDFLNEVRKLDVEIDSWSSDLHVPVTTETTELVSRYEYKQNVTTFNSNIDGSLWYDVPFAYNPFWEDAEKAIDYWVKQGSK